MCKITNKFTFEDNENREAFYEGVYERMLAIQNEEYDYGQYNEEFEEEKDNCEICNDVLLNHIYGNVCKKHIPSYALYDDDEEDDDDEEEFDDDNEDDDDEEEFDDDEEDDDI